MPKTDRWYQTQREVRAVLPLPDRIWDRPAVAPSASICDEPTVCLTFSSAWSPFISGAIATLLDERHWAGDDAEIFRIRQVIERILEQMTYGCGEVAGGIGYGDALDYLDAIIAGYDGTPESVHPLAPDTHFDSDADDTPTEAGCRGNSLCKAAEVVVQTAAAQELTRRASGSSWVAWSGFMASAVIGGFAIGGPLGAAIASLSAVILAGIVNAFQQVSDATLSDWCAQANVACCLANNLAGVDNTYANFKAGLDGCCDLTGDDLALCGAIGYLLQDFSLYLLFNRVLGLTQMDCLYGTQQGCGCDRWCALLDFSEQDHSFGKQCSHCGTYVAGVGWTEQCFKDIGQPGYCRVDIVRNINLGTIKEIEVVFDYQDGGFEGTPPPAFQIVLDNMDYVATIPWGGLREGRNVIRWTGSNNVSTWFRIQIHCRYDNSGQFDAGGSITLRSVKIAGCGASNPLLSCSNCSPAIFPCP